MNDPVQPSTQHSVEGTDVVVIPLDDGRCMIRSDREPMFCYTRDSQAEAMAEALRAVRDFHKLFNKAPQ